VNTIVADNGWLKGYNTDYSAVASLLASHAVAKDIRFALRGSGGMAKAVASAFRDSGFRHGNILARNRETGQALAQGCGYEWSSELGDAQPQMLVNVTPLGMEGGPEASTLAFTPEQVQAAEWVFDVVALPVETPLIRLARELGKPVITGAEVIVLQAVEQFVLYTGVRPEAALIEKAAAFARG
jgi:shikimate dehydrogenase